MNVNVVKAKFSLGQIVHTPGAGELLSQSEMAVLLERHASGDWGDISEADRKENEFSVEKGFRIMSVYHVNGAEFYVVTEWDRSATTVLLSEEY